MGIPLASNFDIGSAIPIDSRDVLVDITARNAIIAGRRFIGMKVFVLSTALNYQLIGGILDANWTEISAGVTAAQVNDTSIVNALIFG